MHVPDVAYTQADGLSIAYRVLGAGSIDVVEVPPFIGHLEATWEEPSFTAFVEGLARFARLLIFDKRGIGLSDRLPPGPDPGFERRAEDIRAVMDAIREISGDAGVTPFDEVLAAIEATWGAGMMAARFGEIDEAVRIRMGRMERQACTPRAAAAYIREIWSSDLRPLAGAIRAPTPVVHNRDHPIWPVAGGRWLAEHIPGARYLEYAEGYGGFFDPEERARLAADVEEFLTGSRKISSTDRVLVTTLYTDIVGSTEHAAAMGDARWRARLAEHERSVREAARRHGGTIVKSLGDGFLLRFDGPTLALRCGASIAHGARAHGLDVRAGVHTGECEIRDGDLVGLAVHVGARVTALAGAGEVLATGTVRDLVLGSAIEFDERGTHTLKGVPGSWPIFAIRPTSLD